MYYNLYKYIFFLDVILVHTREFFNSDVIDWIFKNSFNGSNSDCLDTWNITVYLIFYNGFLKLNYNFFRIWVGKNPVNICTTDKTFNVFEGTIEWKQEK